MIPGDTQIRISLGAIGANMDALQRLIGPDVAIMAVVKANGYGHGAAEIAPTLLRHGAVYLAVARMEEALPLWQAYPDAPLFVLGRTPDGQLEEAVKNRITLTVFSLQQALLLNEIAGKMGKTACIHLKVETGFNRLGTDNVEELAAILQLPHLYAEGIYSHLALLDRAHDEAQLQRLLNTADALEKTGHHFRYRHIADSISAVDYPDFRLNMVRPGAVLYGMKGFESNALQPRPALTFQTRITRLRDLSPGEGVGYDLAWQAARPSRIAALPVGYADGYPRCLGGKGYVTVRGVKCPLVGIMCMDQCVADVTDVPGVQEGDPVILYGDGTNNTLSIAEAASLAGTNKNELLARLSARPARIYED
ncbi:MAG: alanine racemase [Clostridia bacterium]|nr:alanine racemase [Clostridia bacterium]